VSQGVGVEGCLERGGRRGVNMGRGDSDEEVKVRSYGDVDV